MLIKTSRRTPVSIVPKTEQISLPSECLDIIPSYPDLDVSLVIAWTGVMRVHLKSGLLQKNITRFLPVLCQLSGQPSVKASLLTHKLLPLPALQEENVSNYVEDCIIPQGYVHGLADRELLVKTGSGKRLIVLFSDGKCSNTESIVPKVAKHRCDTYIMVITFNAQVQELCIQLADLFNCSVLNGSKIDNNMVYSDLQDNMSDISRWYAECGVNV